LNSNIPSMSFKITEGNSIQAENQKQKIRNYSNISMFFISVLALLTFGLISDSIIFANQLLEISSILGYLYLVTLSAVIYFISAFIFREAIKYFEIASVEKIQTQSEKLSETSSAEAVDFANMIIAKYPNSPAISEFQSQLPHLEYSQILPNISEKILSPIDLEVEQIIFKYAKENAIGTAISPVPLFDAIFLIWRNIRMVNEITNLYGFRAGIIGNMKLLKRVAEQLIFIGASELVVDSFSILTGQTIASKLSSSIAQGIGHSILTIRIGLATIQVSRPIKKDSDISMIVKFLKSFNPFKK